MAALLAALLLDAPGAEVAAELAAETRGRALHPAGEPWSRSLEQSATPRLSLAAGGPDVRLSGSYQARVTAPDLLGPARLDVLQEGRLSAHLLAARPLRLGLALGGTYGTSSLVQESPRGDTGGDSASITGTSTGTGTSTSTGTGISTGTGTGTGTGISTGTGAGTGPVPVSTVDRVKRRGLEAALSIDGPADRTTRGGATLTASSSGGAGEADRRVMPRERALRLDAALSTRLTPVDDLGLALGATESRFDGGSLAAFGVLSVTWRHRLDPSLTASAAAGGGASYSEDPSRPAALRAVLGGELGLAHRLPRPALSSQLALRAAPVVDRLAGTVTERLEAELGEALSLEPGWRFAGRALGSVFRRTPGEARLWRVELRADRSVAHRLALGAGLYATGQRSAAPDLPTFLEAGAFVSLAWEAGRWEVAP